MAGEGQAKKTKRKRPSGGTDPNEVIIALDESRVADQVITRLAALEGSDAVYQRGGVLVGVVPVEEKDLPAGILSIKPLADATLRERITIATALLTPKQTKDGTALVRTTPPKWLIEAIAARGYYQGVRSLSGIVQSPTLRRDGSILQTPGYDDETGLLYSPTIDYPTIPDRPSKQDAIDAAGKLLDVVCDFPLSDDSDRAAWLSMLLTMVARPAIDGCCPLFAVTSNTRGAGKGLLFDVASIVTYGRKAARETYPLDADELRKRVTSVLVEGRPFTLLDNIDRKLGGAALDGVLTSQTWSDRLLGFNKTTGEIPAKTIWAATGNNLLFGSDIARRVLPIRLTSPLENPEDRNDFRIPELLPFVESHRAELAAAALTIVRAYYAAGCPAVDRQTWGSFEKWNSVIRGALVWCGLSDPMATRETAREQDDTAGLLRLLVHGLREADPDGGGLTVKEIERLTSHRVDESPSCPTLMEAIGEICGDKFNAKQVAGRLRTCAGRIVDGFRIQAKTARAGVKRWIVDSVNGGFGGFGGFSSIPTRSEKNAYAHIERLETNQSKQPKQPSIPQGDPVCPKCGGTIYDAFYAGVAQWDCPKCDVLIPADELQRVTS